LSLHLLALSVKPKKGHNRVAKIFSPRFSSRLPFHPRWLFLLPQHTMLHSPFGRRNRSSLVLTHPRLPSIESANIVLPDASHAALQPCVLQYLAQIPDHRLVTKRVSVSFLIRSHQWKAKNPHSPTR